MLELVCVYTLQSVQFMLFESSAQIVNNFATKKHAHLDFAVCFDIHISGFVFVFLVVRVFGLTRFIHIQIKVDSKYGQNAHEK